MAKMLQPTKNRLREALRAAADRIEELTGERNNWKAEVDVLAAKLDARRTQAFVFGLIVGVGAIGAAGLLWMVSR